MTPRALEILALARQARPAGTGEPFRGSPIVVGLYAVLTLYLINARPDGRVEVTEGELADLTGRRRWIVRRALRRLERADLVSIESWAAGTVVYYLPKPDAAAPVKGA